MNVKMHKSEDDTVTVSLSLVELIFLHDALGSKTDAGRSLRTVCRSEHPGRQFVELLDEFYKTLQGAETIREVREHEFAR